MSSANSSGRAGSVPLRDSKARLRQSYEGCEPVKARSLASFEQGRRYDDRMSVAVEIAKLGEQVAAFGPVALVVTVAAGGGPHIVSAPVGLADEELVADVGRTTSGNVEQTPTVSLVWPAAAG